MTNRIIYKLLSRVDGRDPSDGGAVIEAHWSRQAAERSKNRPSCNLVAEVIDMEQAKREAREKLTPVDLLVLGSLNGEDALYCPRCGLLNKEIPMPLYQAKRPICAEGADALDVTQHDVCVDRCFAWGTCSTLKTQYDVCVDCLAYLANGDVPHDKPEGWARRVEREIKHQLGERKGHMVPGVRSTSDDPEGTGKQDFSHQLCELCGALPGERHGATLIFSKE